MSEVVASKHTKGVISRFTLRRVALGASLFGLFAAIESVAQGLGIVEAYPNLAARAKVINSLTSNSVFGLFYGNKHADIISPAGYMVYRILPILGLIGSIWALLFITKMLRGQEEAGRWELFLSGQTSAGLATARTILGAFGGMVIAYIWLFLILLLAGHSPKLTLAVPSTLLYCLAIMSGAVITLGIGAITSQLAATRRKAVLYGSVVIVILFGLRSIGNVVNSLSWLKDITPYGWIDKLSPFYHASLIWLLPIVCLSLILPAIAIYLASKRDMAESIIADSSTAKPSFKLLKSQMAFDFRLTRNTLFAWLFSSVIFAALISAIDKTVTKSLTNSHTFTKAFSNLTGNPDSRFEVAYLSSASYFVVIILMIVMTTGIGSARDEEASSRLDNFLSGNVSRVKWLSSRLALLIASAAVISVLSSLVVWLVARAQGIHVSFSSLIFGGLNILGPVVLLLGFGVLLFGLIPRFTTIAMFALIGWSFTVDILAATLKNTKFLSHLSLLHYMSLVPAASPKWQTFVILVLLSLVLCGTGVTLFNKRDLEVE